MTERRGHAGWGCLSLGLMLALLTAWWGLQAPVPAATAAPSTLDARVMSWNIMTGRKTVRQLAVDVPARDVTWSARQPQILAWIHDIDPDIAGLQENEGIAGSTDRQSDRLAPLLPEYGWAMKDHNLPIIYRAARYHLVDQGVFRIGQPGQDGGHFNRWCTWAKLEDRSTGAQMVVFNAHTEPFQTARAATARAASYPRLINGMQTINPHGRLPYVLVGDFNARSDETRPRYRDHLRVLPQAGMVDTHDKAAKITTDIPGAASYSGYGIVINGRWRLGAVRTYDYYYDYIFARSDVTVRTWQVATGPGSRQIKIGERAYPFYADRPLPSDHNPVIAELVWHLPDGATRTTPSPSVTIPIKPTPTGTPTRGTPTAASATPADTPGGGATDPPERAETPSAEPSNSASATPSVRLERQTASPETTTSLATPDSAEHTTSTPRHDSPTSSSAPSDSRTPNAAATPETWTARAARSAQSTSRHTPSTKRAGVGRSSAENAQRQTQQSSTAPAAAAASARRATAWPYPSNRRPRQQTTIAAASSPPSSHAATPEPALAATGSSRWLWTGWAGAVVLVSSGIVLLRASRRERER